MMTFAIARPQRHCYPLFRLKNIIGHFTVLWSGLLIVAYYFQLVIYTEFALIESASSLVRKLLLWKYLFQTFLYKFLENQIYFCSIETSFYSTLTPFLTLSLYRFPMVRFGKEKLSKIKNDFRVF